MTGVQTCALPILKHPNRDRLREALNNQGIASGVHYYPNHLFDMYKGYYRYLSVSENIWKSLITLPLYPDMIEDDFDLIIRTITENS